jgi:fucose permease
MDNSFTRSKKISNTTVIKLALILTVWVFSMFCGTLSTFIMQASHFFHASLTSAGTLETYQNGAVIVCSFIAFSFILKKGYRQSIIVILILMIILSIIAPIINTYWVLKLFLVGTGVVLAGMKICIYASAAIICKEENEQAGLLSLLEATWMISGMAGMWVIAFFVSKTPDHWLNFLYLYAIIGVVNLIVWMFVRMDESALTREKATPVIQQIKEMLTMCKNKLIIAAIIMIFIGSILEMGFNAWLPGFYEAALNISPSLSLKIASFGALATFGGRIFAFILLKYMKWQKMLLCYYIVGLVFLVLVLFSMHASGQEITHLSSVSWMALIFPAFGFFFAPNAPVLNSSILSRTAKEKQALLMTILAVVFAVASSITARGIGYMMQHLGGIVGFQISTIIPLIILIALIIPYSKFLKTGKVE